MEQGHLSEVPLDIHVKDTFKRMFEGTRLGAAYDADVQNIAKLVYPECPGALDRLLWETGRKKGARVP